eukprot:4953373-Pleurochrysis_carterae.AAC.1
MCPPDLPGSGSSTIKFTKNSTEQPLKGRGSRRSPGPTLLTTRTPELPCFTFLILYEGSTRVTTNRAGRSDNKYIHTDRRGLGASTGAEAEARLCGGSGK